jgi:hypothetical protein
LKFFSPTLVGEVFFAHFGGIDKGKKLSILEIARPSAREIRADKKVFSQKKGNPLLTEYIHYPSIFLSAHTTTPNKEDLHMEPMIDKDTHLRALKVVGQAYESSRFSEIFPLLAEDAVWESQWRLDPERGRDQVIRYYKIKEEALRNAGVRIRWAVVELVDNLNPMPGNDGQGNRVHVGLYYPEGKLCLYMEQALNGEINGMIIDLTMNEDGLITRIDMCMPELFQFKRYEE